MKQLKSPRTVPFTLRATFLLLVFAQTSFSQLSGPLSGTLGPGEFHIVDTISVEQSDTLTLMPGTTFNFDGPYPFHIYGTLLAEGTESDSIVFTTDTLANPERWRGLRFVDSTSSGSVLSYCLIENGYASGESPYDCGGGIYCNQSSLIFSDCEISHNLAFLHGAGVYCQGNSCSPSFINCTINGNRKHGYEPHSGGGGIYCWSASPSFTDCIISGNRTNYGGGIYCYNCGANIPSFTNCLISDNLSILNAGGVYSGNASPSFTNCIIVNNTAYYYYSNGGGVYCWGQSSPHFESCTIAGNYAAESGGGVRCGRNASPVFIDCEISENYAISGGGIDCYERGGTPTFINCTISNNEGIQGGGISCYLLASPNFVNCTINSNSSNYGAAVSCNGIASPSFLKCTISNNVVINSGAGVYCFHSSPRFNSTTIAFTDGDGIFFDSSAACRIEYCAIYGNSGEDIAFNDNDSTVGPQGVGQLDTTNANGDSCDVYFNIFLDPMFVDASEDDYHLMAGSPCIDAGDPELPFDPDSTIADIGAFYFNQVYAEEPGAVLPVEFTLHPNYPNPFNPTTSIRYDVAQTNRVTLTIYNLLGQHVTQLVDKQHQPGSYIISWNAIGQPSGLYFCRMEALGFIQTRKLVLLK